MSSFENCTGYLITDDYQWFPVVYTGKIEQTQSALTTEFVTALGKRSVFARGTQPRQWQIQAEAPLKWARALLALAQAPAKRFYWLSPLGVHTNILPSANPALGFSMGLREIDGQPVEIYTRPTMNLSPRIPVKAGTTLYGSAYLPDGGNVQIGYYDASDRLIGTSKLAVAAAGTALTKVPASTVPENAHRASLVIQGTSTCGGLAIWMEAHSLPTGGASACGWVTLHDVSVGHGNIAYPHSPVSVSFTLKEVT